MLQRRSVLKEASGGCPYCRGSHQRHGSGLWELVVAPYRLFVKFPRTVSEHRAPVYHLEFVDLTNAYPAFVPGVTQEPI